MELSRALQAYVESARDASGGEAICSIISQAVSDGNVFNFGELLDCPTIEAYDEANRGSSAVEQLRIFAYGTLSDYEVARQSGKVPPLTPEQHRKLVMLTVVSLASKAPRISFNTLRQELQMDDQRAIEDVVMDTIYAGLIDAKIDQAAEFVEIDRSASRDVRWSDIDSMLEVLSGWKGSTETVLSRLRQDAKKQIEAAQGAMLASAAKLEADGDQRAKSVASKDNSIAFGRRFADAEPISQRRRLHVSDDEPFC